MQAEDIIIKPIVTEKSTLEISEGKYTFAVNKKASKIQIRKAIEELFNVKVLSVNTMNMLGKTRIQRGIKGKKSDWKKAIVKIDTDPEEETYFEEKGKEKKTSRKYNSEIEGFMEI